MSITPQAERARGGAAKCPLCARAAKAPFRPFCGQGCRDRDLLNWLGDAYRVPGPPAHPEAEQEPSSGLDRWREPPL